MQMNVVSQAQVCLSRSHVCLSVSSSIKRQRTKQRKNLIGDLLDSLASPIGEIIKSNKIMSSGENEKKNIALYLLYDDDHIFRKTRIEF
jgi:hypothetical protein